MPAAFEPWAPLGSLPPDKDFDSQEAVMRKGWLGRVGMAAFLGLSVMATGGGWAEVREPLSQVPPH